MHINIRNPVWSVVLGTGLLAFATQKTRWRKEAAATGAGLITRGLAMALRQEFAEGFARGRRPAQS